MATAKDLRQLWLQSLLVSDTYIGREKSMRAFQYCARMLFGLTDREIFGSLLRTLALSRKTLRFYKPVKAVKRIEDIRKDPAIDGLDKTLTVIEVGSDAIYAAIDHITFVQRIGGLSWMKPKQVDNLDRFLEFFWLTEVLPVIFRELRKYVRLNAPMEPNGLAPKDAALRVAEARKTNLLLLIKAAMCDFPCTIYFMSPAAFKSKRVHKSWCGFLGVVASLISLHLNWPRGKCKDE